MRSLSKFVPFNSSIWKFLTFNTGLPLFDMGTDFRTFFFYLSVASFHPNWAMLTLGWILVPFFLHVCKFLHHLVTTGEAKWKELLLHVPFVLPLRNAYFAQKLNKLGFGESNPPYENPEAKQGRLKSIEEIQKQVAKDGLSESYFESGPQAPGCIEELIFIFPLPNLFFCNLKTF